MLEILSSFLRYLLSNNLALLCYYFGGLIEELASLSICIPWFPSDFCFFMLPFHSVWESNFSDFLLLLFNLSCSFISWERGPYVVGLLNFDCIEFSYCLFYWKFLMSNGEGISSIYDSSPPLLLVDSFYWAC